VRRRPVRGADFVPQSHRFGERRFRVRSVALSKAHPSSSEVALPATRPAPDLSAIGARLTRSGDRDLGGLPVTLFTDDLQ
jgi:hypothetical protein